MLLNSGKGNANLPSILACCLEHPEDHNSWTIGWGKIDIDFPLNFPWLSPCVQILSTLSSFFWFCLSTYHSASVGSCHCQAWFHVLIRLALFSLYVLTHLPKSLLQLSSKFYQRIHWVKSQNYILNPRARLSLCLMSWWLCLTRASGFLELRILRRWT